MKLLLIGDVHGDVGFLRRTYAHAAHLGADRAVLLGDVGLGWDRRMFKGTGGRLECIVVHALADLVAASGIPALVLDGNHENFDWLGDELDARTPQPDGTVELAPGVAYVPRGTLLVLDGLRVLALGGAVSLDRLERVPGRSWWPQEAITRADVDRAAQQGPADLLLTHDAPAETTAAHVGLLTAIWGEALVRETWDNSVLVSEVLAHCRAGRLIHGHVHRRADERVHNANGPVLVQALNCNLADVSRATVLVDTDTVDRTTGTGRTTQ